MMKTAAFAIALLLSGAAIAQTTQPDYNADADVAVQPDVNVDTSVNVDTPATTTTTTPDTMTPSVTMASTTPASEAIIQPSNASPEKDARGITVMSDPAMVPAGWNGIAGTAMGGPLVDPATGETIAAADSDYPACSATVTDNCLQTYERGRSS
jgi:hypothetical protein